MKNIQSYFLIVLLFLTLCNIGSKVKAEDGVAVNKNFQGIWVAPDCRNWDKIKYISNNFVFKYDLKNKSYAVENYKKINSNQEYEVMSFANQSIPARVLEDGILQQVEIEKNADFSKDWDSLPIIKYHEYMHCFDTELPEIFPDLIEITAILDNLYSKCSITINDNCKEALFASYMSSEGEFLDKKSVTNFINNVNILAKIIGKKTVNVKNASKNIFNIFDLDNNNKITLGELLNKKQISNSKIKLSIIKNNIDNIADILSLYIPAIKD